MREREYLCQYKFHILQFYFNNIRKINLFLWPCLDSIRLHPWNLSYVLCRFGDVIILLISIVCFIFNIHFLFSQRRLHSLLISLFLASLLVYHTYLHNYLHVNIIGQKCIVVLKVLTIYTDRKCFRIHYRFLRANVCLIY